MRHPSEGTLRRLVDEPAGVADADREHVAGCSHCRAGLAAAREDAAAVAAVLSTGTPASAAAAVPAMSAVPAVSAGSEMDTGTAWDRLSRAVAAQHPQRPGGTPSTPAISRSRRRANVLRSPVAAAFGVVALFTGAGVAAAADWLPVFRAERIAPIAITEQDLVRLPDLSLYGEFSDFGEPDVRQVADAQAAEALTGLPVPRVGDLPRGVTGEPAYQVASRVSATFTFSAAAATDAAARVGDDLPTPPPGMDGNRFRFDAGPGVALTWTSSSGAPGLVVGRGVAPTVYSSGVPFDVARDYLLSLPGISGDLAEQLRGLSADGSTLPLPVPADAVTTRDTDVNGVPAEVLRTRDGTMTAVVWVQDGVVTVVAGSLSDGEVLSVARGLR